MSRRLRAIVDRGRSRPRAGGDTSRAALGVPSIPPDLSETDPVAGLSTVVAGERRAAGLGNAYHPPSSRTYWEIVRDHSYPLINGPLLVISALLVAFGLAVEALLTAGPVLTNIAIGVFQGARAKRALDRVALLSRPRAIVVRDAVEREIDPAELVLGDLVVAARGDEIQVDGRVTGYGRGSVDESALTGESEPTDKRAGDDVLSGSAVISGQLRYVALAVGQDTFANRILAQAKGRRDVATPLQRDVARAIGGVGVLVLVSAVLVALTGFRPPDETTREAVVNAAVLVTLVPQGLALMLTVAYAAAALRISGLGVVVQRQSAIEAMSRIDTFCTDKTGTLTTQRIEFRRLEPIGSSIDPRTLGLIVGTYAASTTAPNATIRALTARFGGSSQPVMTEVPFSSSLRWSAIRFADVATSTGAAPAIPGSTFVLGVPEVLLSVADPMADRLEERARDLAATGERVLLFARGGVLLAGAEDDPPASPGPIEPLAFLTFAEELRPTAQATIEGFRARGIEVKVVSGDDPGTVAAIGARLGLPTDGRAASGLELGGLGDDALGAVAERATVLGRVDPLLKARIVRALKTRGRSVAMTGDGVNDIPPVRAATVGVAMRSGSAATRGVADVVLLDDDFSVLPEAIRDGQRIVAAMTATLVVLLARTFYVLLIVVGAALAALPFPFTPRQNSILAFVTVGVPIIALALWVEPRPVRGSILGQTLRVSIPVSLAVAAVGLPVYAAALQLGASIGDARTALTTLASFMGLGLLTLIPLAADRVGPSWLPRWSRTLLLIGAMAIVYLVVLALPIGRAFFELEPLVPGLVAALGFVAIAWTVIVLLVRRTGVVQRGIDRLLRPLEGRHSHSRPIGARSVSADKS
jgi:cation-transporting P-type ATPase E